jgi:hypothetical protein
MHSACLKGATNGLMHSSKYEIAALQSSADWSRAYLRLFRNLIVAHDVILPLVMHLKPTWLAEVSIGSA